MKSTIRLRSQLRAILWSLTLLGMFPATQAVLVRKGSEGLEYQAYANEGQSEAVHTVPDFSSAGYGGGGVPIPFVPVARISSGPCPDSCSEECIKIPIILPLKPTGGDDSSMIQCAINRVAKLEPRPGSSFRGAVVLSPGTFRVTRPLKITTGGIVIRGAGSQSEGGTRIVFDTQKQEDLFLIQGGGNTAVRDHAGGLPQAVGDAVRVEEELIPVGATKLPLAGTPPFGKGDLIRITHTMNQQWIKDLGVDRIRTPDGKLLRGWSSKDYQLRTYRVVEKVEGTEITLNAPIMQAIEKKYGGAKVEKVDAAHVIEHIGIEGLRLESTFDHDFDEGHGWRAVHISLGVQHAWVRQVTAVHFGHSLVTIEPGSQWITVEDCAFLDPKSILAFRTRLGFGVNMSTNVLVQRCYARDGWHDYSTGLKTTGPNVFVDSVSTSAHHQVGPRETYSTGDLYDNLLLEALPYTESTPLEPGKDGSIRIQKRTVARANRGWSGAQIMVWNSKAPEVVVDAPVGAMNWAVGVSGRQLESKESPGDASGIWESPQRPVQPRSLYYAQLADRVGLNALKWITVPDQEKGPIWRQLKEWQGEGVFLDPLVTWHDQELKPIVGVPILLQGGIRDLWMKEYQISIAWKKVSGPGEVRFENPNALKTLATFEASGRYTLQLDVGDGSRTVSSTLLVFVEESTEFPTVPDPVEIKATVKENVIRLTWPTLKREKALQFDLYRSTSAGELGERIVADIQTNRYVDRDLAYNTSYTYVLTKIDETGYPFYFSNKKTVKTEKAVEKVHRIRRADFGARWDKITARNAGFRVKVPGGLGGHYDEVYRVWNPTQEIYDYSIVRDFVEVKDPDWNDFSVKMEASLWSRGMPGELKNQFGVLLFGNADRPLHTGIRALIRYEEEQIRMVLQDGMTEQDLAQVVFHQVPLTDGIYPFPLGRTYTFELSGTFPDQDTLELSFTLTDGENTESLTVPLPVSRISHFAVGGIAQIGYRFSIDFDTIEFLLIELPE